MFSQARSYNESGNYDRALEASNQAKSFSIVAIILGLVLNVPPIILICAVIGVSSTS